MDCERIEELLSPYLEDELTLEDKRDVEEHLTTCLNCSSLLAYLKETFGSLADFPEIEISDNLLNRLYEIPSKKKKFKLSFEFLLRPALQPVLTATTVLLIMMSFYLFHPNKNLIDKSIDRQIHLGYSKVEKLYSEAEFFTNSLAAYKEDILVSLKKTKLFGGTEE